MCWQEVVRIGYYMPYLWVHESERTGICRHGECGGDLSDLSADAVAQLVVRVELIASHMGTFSISPNIHI